MRFCTASSLSALALAVLPVVRAGYWDTTAPLLAFSTPKSFLGLEGELSKPIGNIAFLPGLHPCGTLTCFVLDEGDLEFSDFDLFHQRHNSTDAASDHDALSDGTTAKGLRDWFDAAADSTLERAAYEGTVVAWAKGWRATCGRGAVNKQVKVVKLKLEGVDPNQGRQAFVDALDARITPYLDMLEPAPHNNLVMLTTMTSSTQRLLFDVATPPISSRPGGNAPSDDARGPHGSPDSEVGPGRRHSRGRRGWLYRLVGHLIDLAIASVVLVGFAYAARFAQKKWSERKEGGQIRLPFSSPSGTNPNSRDRQEQEAFLDLDAE
ncbi:hypothetical protein JCM10212_001694 [Sporobolomyces blumeae]